MRFAASSGVGSLAIKMHQAGRKALFVFVFGGSGGGTFHSGIRFRVGNVPTFGICYSIRPLSDGMLMLSRTGKRYR